MMEEKRIRVWVQQFKDRDSLMLQWHDPETGKRKTRSADTDDKEKAEKARADLEYELNHGLYKEASRMTWEDFRKKFEEEYFPNRREETRKVYRNVFNLFEKICNPRSLRSINVRTVTAFEKGLRQQPGRGGSKDKTMQASTIKVRLQFLETALNWAVTQKMLPSCPKFPDVKVPKTKPRPVPTESFDRLIAKAPDEHTRVFLYCGWLAGLRRNEALGLEWEETEDSPWIDFDSDRIILPATFTKAVEDQWVPLDQDLRDMLEALPRNGPKVFRFMSTATGEPLTPSGVSLMITKLAKDAGVKLSMKTLRKAFGSRYAQTESAQVLQKLMRHANITTTLAYYANVDDAVEQAVRRKRRRNNEAVTEPRKPDRDDASSII